MKLHPIPDDLTVCQVPSIQAVDLTADFYFIGRTDEELSLVCKTKEAPDCALAREDGWKAFRIQGVLDFSLVGILAKLSGILAEQQIGIFAVSTYNTDYILVKKDSFDRAISVLKSAGYTIE